MQRGNYSHLYLISPHKKQPEYKQKYDKIQNIVTNLNNKLTHMFQLKEKQLINDYTNQMQKVKQELNELKIDVNEEQIKKKFVKKKQSLEKQRQHHLQASIFFCNKYENFKRKLKKVIEEARDLQNQVQFLNKKLNQIGNMNPKNNQSSEQNIKSYKKNHLDLLNNSIIFTKKQLQDLRKNQSSLQSKKTKNSIEQVQAIRKNQRKYSSIKRNQSEAAQTIKNTKNIDKIKQALASDTFKITKFEKMFDECVQKIILRKKQRRKYTKKTQKQKILLSSINKFYQYELNDFDKKNIMEQFFSKEQVKFYLYQIIFKDIHQLEKGTKAHIFDKNFI